MFIAMNRFEIAKGFEEGFEKVWRERESFLSDSVQASNASRDSQTLCDAYSVWSSRSFAIRAAASLRSSSYTSGRRCSAAEGSPDSICCRIWVTSLMTTIRIRSESTRIYDQDVPAPGRTH